MITPSPDATTWTPQRINLFKSHVVSVADPLIDDPITGEQHTVIMALEPPFTVLTSIPVTIRKIDGEFVASFDEANINTSGDTWNEAVFNLKHLLVDVFDDLLSQPAETLGKSVKHQLEVLKLFVGKQ